jgi:hypothetical protein
MLFHECVHGIRDVGITANKIRQFWTLMPAQPFHVRVETGFAASSVLDKVLIEKREGGRNGGNSNQRFHGSVLGVVAAYEN